MPIHHNVDERRAGRGLPTKPEATNNARSRLLSDISSYVGER